MANHSLAVYILLLLCSHFALSLTASIPRPYKTQFASTKRLAVRSFGTTYVGSEDTSYGVDSWLGIRYAKAPVGSLRLKPPQPLVGDEGTVTATGFGSQCFQMDPGVNATLSEDCLFLNIYRPSPSSMDRIGRHYSSSYAGLPVMVWIHGGGFNDGSGQIYDSRSLVNTSVSLDSPTVVVTINYRLSFFGFSAGKDAIANDALNLGLLDQRQALTWIQNNIHIFGGDPSKVTLVGQSAGATSIGLQITAYDGKSEDLFRAAILESGSPQDSAPTPPSNWTTYQQAWDAVVAGVGCSNSTNVFSCVQNVTEQTLFKTVVVVGRGHAPLPSSTYPWQPVVDGTFISDFPSKLLKAGKFVKIPTIVGFTTDEVTYAIPTNLNISSDSSLAGLAEYVLPFAPTATIEEILTLDPLSSYPNTYGVGGTEWKRATEIASDIFERCPGRAFIRNVTEFSNGWRYRWNAIIPAELALAPEQGVVHAAEIPYVFGPSITPYINETVDIALSLVVQKAWLSFAAHLDPNCLGDLESGVSWPKYNNATEQVLVFQTTDGAHGMKGQGLYAEKDPDDRPACDFIIGHDADFVR